MPLLYFEAMGVEISSLLPNFRLLFCYAGRPPPLSVGGVVSTSGASRLIWGSKFQAGDFSVRRGKFRLGCCDLNRGGDYHLSQLVRGSKFQAGDFRVRRVQFRLSCSDLDGECGNRFC